MTAFSRSPAFTALPLALAAATLFAGTARAQTATDAAPATAAAELSTIEIVGRTESGTYQAQEASGAKTDLPLRELPQSVRVITRQAIDDLGATRLDDVLDYVGGVSRQNNFGGLWDNVAIRGLPGNENTGSATLLNGFSGNRGFNAPRDMAGVERIEFLKGPAAALYGSSEPGGTLNIVTKRPQWTSANAVEGYAGSHGYKRAALDSTGPLGENVAYRLNVAAEDRDSFRDHVSSQRQVVAPAFTWKLGGGTVLDYSGEYLRHRAPLDRGVVAVNNQLGALPRSRFLGEPADGDMTVENVTHQLSLLHEWNAQWRSRMALSYRTTSMEGFSTEASTLLSDGTLRRQRRYRDFSSDDTALQAELIGNVQWGGMPHELLMGVETYRYTLDARMLRINPTAAAPYGINIFNPVYGQPQPTPGPNTDFTERQRNLAFYAQDAIQIAPQWRVLAGARFDRYRQNYDNHRTGTTDGQDPTAASPRVGVSWLPNAQWTVYANAGTSFRPNSSFTSSVGRNGLQLDPEKGRALELGVKWESADQRLGATAAVFDITKRNMLTTDPLDANFQITAGKVRSRGAEFDLAGQLSTHWRLNASLVLNDVEVVSDNTLEIGGRLLNVPRVNGSVLAVYEDALAGGQRYGVGGGVTHVGKRLGAARTQAEATAGTPAFELPAYTTAKLVAYWRLTPTMRLTLDVDNVFDKTYYTTSVSRLWVTPGTARTVTVGLQARF
ncbi:TonB-dependent siderophore receptor [Paracidovorax anthurii]|uniref:Iron complex outermembrane receptor protein n=1 Tax=Paracidovorax anthurii TaxID=78229 RepID=A0A328ZHK0_9BURK|nr:TonB-dependent siderophore receptor [Paracidovorax anthurii]RAR82257.1 iron complex outermembrane receptor protein [Paracidovorax anthurii]